jgi:hypothetical protein
MISVFAKFLIQVSCFPNFVESLLLFYILLSFFIIIILNYFETICWFPFFGIYC